MNYAQQLQRLMDAITGDDPEPMLPLIATARHNSLPTLTRLNVYRNAYVIRLVDATMSDYKSLVHYMGEDEARTLARAYVKATPSRFWDLNQYSIGFADYVLAHHADPAVHALAQLESAITFAQWAPDSHVLDAQMLAQLTPETLAEQHFTLRTAIRLLHLLRGAHAYLTALRNEAPLKEVPAEEEYLCVLRHPHRVYRHVLTRDEYQLLCAIAEGGTFGAALEKVAACQPDGGLSLASTLTSYLTRWFQEGFFATH